MKITLAMVMSLDAKVTKWFNPNIYEWTSSEDKKHFFSLIKRQKVIVMGSKTYNASKKHIKLTPFTLRIVLTSNPKKYLKQRVKGQLEFKNVKPEKLIKSLETLKYSSVLLVGGSQLNSAFLRSKLVNEIWVTIEPKIFGMGNTLVTEDDFNISLKLKSSKQLNNKGTLLLKYKVIS